MHAGPVLLLSAIQVIDNIDKVVGRLQKLVKKSGTGSAQTIYIYDRTGLY
jgi:hypothetical protein